MAGVCTGDGPCDVSPLGTGNNWVTKRGGLPPYVRAVANQFIRSGTPESSAISLAIAAIKRWASGGGKVTAKTRASAAAALSQWEAMKGASLSNVDLSFNPAEARGFGGKWTSGTPAQKQAQKAQMAKAKSSYAMNAGKPGSASKGKSGGKGSAAKKAASASLASSTPATKASIAKAALINALPADQRAALAGSTPPAGFKWANGSLVPSGAGVSASASGASKAATAQKTAASKAASAAKSAASKQASANAASALPATKSSTARAAAINSLSAVDRTTASQKAPPAGFKWTTKQAPDGSPTLVPTATNLSNGGPMFQRIRRVIVGDRPELVNPQVPRIIELANGSMAERMLPDEAAVRKASAGLPKMTDPKLRTVTRIMIKNRAEALGMDVGSLKLSVPMNLRAGARETAKAAGKTLPGTTSYPTQTRAEFDKAILAVGRGGAEHDTIRAYLIRRGKAEGWPTPGNWQADGSIK